MKDALMRTIVALALIILTPCLRAETTDPQMTYAQFVQFAKPYDLTKIAAAFTKADPSAKLGTPPQTGYGTASARLQLTQARQTLMNVPFEKIDTAAVTANLVANFTLNNAAYCLAIGAEASAQNSQTMAKIWLPQNQATLAGIETAVAKALTTYNQNPTAQNNINYWNLRRRAVEFQCVVTATQQLAGQ